MSLLCVFFCFPKNEGALLLFSPLFSKKKKNATLFVHTMNLIDYSLSTNTERESPRVRESRD